MGGNVVDVYTLGIGRAGNLLEPLSALKKELISKFGNKDLALFLNEYGRKDINSLTHQEANLLNGFNTLDEARVSANDARSKGIVEGNDGVVAEAQISLFNNEEEINKAFGGKEKKRELITKAWKGVEGHWGYEDWLSTMRSQHGDRVSVEIFKLLLKPPSNKSLFCIAL